MSMQAHEPQVSLNVERKIRMADHINLHREPWESIPPQPAQIVECSCCGGDIDVARDGVDFYAADGRVFYRHLHGSCLVKQSPGQKVQ